MSISNKLAEMGFTDSDIVAISRMDAKQLQRRITNEDLLIDKFGIAVHCYQEEIANPGLAERRCVTLKESLMASKKRKAAFLTQLMVLMAQGKS